MFSNGSYFGDNEVLLQKNGFRSTTAICQKDSQIYAIKNNSLEECLDKYHRIRMVMTKIAEEKNKYYAALREEIKLKYKSKREQEKLIKDKKGDEWTYHMSRKRQQVKKSARIQSQMDKIRKPENISEFTNAEEKAKIDHEIKN